MKTRILNLAMVLSLAVFVAHANAAVVVTDSGYQPQGSFTAVVGDLIEGNMESFTGTELYGGSVGMLTDGTWLGGWPAGNTEGLYAPSNGSVVTYALDLDAVPAGYNIDEIISGTGYLTQYDYSVFDIEVSYVGNPNSFSLLYALNVPSTLSGFWYDRQVIVSDDTGYLAEGVAKIRFTFHQVVGSESIHRELDVVTTEPVPGAPLNIDSVFNEQHSDIWDNEGYNGHAYYETGCNSWFIDTELLLDHIPFRLKIDAYDVLSGSCGGIESFEIPIDASPNSIYVLGSAFNVGAYVDDLDDFNIEIVYQDGDTEEQIPLNTKSLKSRWYDLSNTEYGIASFLSGGKYGDDIGQDQYTTRLFTYILIPNQNKPIKSLYFNDNTRTGEFAIAAITLSDTIPYKFDSVLGDVVRREHPYVEQPSSSSNPPIPSANYLMWDLSDYFNDEMDNAVDMGYGIDCGRQISLDPSFSSEDYTMEGIPFRVKLTGKNCVSSSLKGLEKYTFSINENAREIHLLMSAYFDLDNTTDEMEPDCIRRYDYFMVEVKYDDGVVDKIFPLNPQTGKHRIYQKTDTQILYHYVIYPTQDKTIDSLSICDGFDRGDFVLYAMTLDPLAFSWSEPDPPAKLTDVPDISPSSPTISQNGDEVTLENAYARMIIEGIQNATPLKIKTLYNKYISQDCLNANKSYPFALFHSYDNPQTSHDTLLTDDFTISNLDIQNEPNRVELNFQMNPNGRSDFRLDVKFTMMQEEEIKFDISAINLSSQKAAFVLFPMLANIQIGASAQNDLAFFPPDDGFIYDGQIDYRVNHGGHCYLQIMDVTDPCAGGGVYYRIADTVPEMKLVSMIRTGVTGESISRDNTYITQGGLHCCSAQQVGTGMSFELWAASAAASGTYTMPSVYIGVHKSNWRAAMYAYRGWMENSFPQHTIPQWLKESFYFSSGHTTLCHDDDIYKFNNIQDVDNMQVFGWFNFPGNSYTGSNDEYTYRTDWGDSNSLENAVTDAQENGCTIGYYLEGLLFPGHFSGGTWHNHITDDPSDDPSWTNTRASRVEIPEGTDYGMMCPGAPLWQDFLTQTCARLVRDTGALQVYLDSVTNGPPIPCCNPTHNHENIYQYSADVVELFRVVREGIRAENADACLTAESPGTDRAAAELDGAHIYYRPPYVLERPTNNGLMHFFFPDKKWTGLYSFAWHIAEAKVVAFFGDALCVVGTNMGSGPTELSPYRQQPHPEIYEIIMAMKPLWRQFTSEESVPLIDTERYGLYANKFIFSSYPVVYTLYNNNPYTLHGHLLEVDSDHEDLYNTITMEDITIEESEGKYFINCDIDPGEVLILTTTIKGDLNGDGSVDIKDLVIFAEQWLTTGQNIKSDLNNDETVNWLDFAELASVWQG